MRWSTVLLLLLVIATGILPPAGGLAQDSRKTVRVGWFESPFNRTDRFGRHSGYSYEFQQKIAAYSDWKYEYVEGSWVDLFEMLIRGEIDLMSDISFTPERSGLMLFASDPMGSEEYYLYTAEGNYEAARESPSWFAGRKVGVNRGSIQAELLKDWQEKTGIRVETVEVACPEAESFRMLSEGELDGFLTLDAYGGHEEGVPIIKIGSSDFFFAVRKDRQDLLEDLNAAMSRIQDENRYYVQQLSEKYFTNSGSNLFISSPEKDWLVRHGTIRVGYQDNHLSFCDRNENTGELTGALKEYLDYASDCMENAHLSFEAVAYPSAEAAMAAVKSGEVDCMFPSCLSSSDSEELGLVMTPRVMETEVYAVVRRSDQSVFAAKDHVVTAVERGNPNYTTALMDHFPEWQTAEYPDVEACLLAVAKGEADCVLISNYCYNHLGNLCEKYSLAPLATGKEVEYFFAVGSGNKELYSILTRTTGLIRNSAISAALTYYSAEESKTGLLDLIAGNPLIVIAVFIVLISLLAVIVAQNRMLRAEKEVEETHSQVDDLSRRVFVDALTAVRNKGAFTEMIDELEHRVERKESLGFAIAVFDCDDLKQINDRYGHDKGDIYLKSAAHLICHVYVHSPVFRIGGDEFAAILQNEDYANRKELRQLFEQQVKAVSSQGENRWEKAVVSMGMAEYDPQTDRSVEEVIRRADKDMYEIKRAHKHSRSAG